MQRLPTLIAISGAMIGLCSTGCVSQARHARLQRQLVTLAQQLEVKRNLHRNVGRDLRRAVRDRTALIGRTKSQRRALLQARGRLIVARHQTASCRRRITRLQAPHRRSIRPMDHVVFQETLIWGGSISPRLARLFQSARRRLAACYAAYVTTSGKDAVSVLRVGYQVTARSIRSVQFFRSSRSPRLLRQCVAQVIRTQALPRPKRTWRVSQAIAFAPQRRLADRAPYAAYRFPWRLPRRYRAGPGQLCSLGSRHRRQLQRSQRLNPFYARPCAAGLRCCGGCGVPGCDGFCRRKCGPPKP